MPTTVLVVEDEMTLRGAVAQYLQSTGYEVMEAGSATEAAQLIERVPPQAALVDYSLPGDNGLAVVDLLHQADPNIPVIMLTAHGTIDLAVQAIKRGAEQFLTKPVELRVIEVVLRRALAQQQTRRVKQASSRLPLPNPFLGVSDEVRRLEEQAHRLAAAERPILLYGETGTGKTVLARWLHLHSGREREPFVDINCAGFARELLETELFGHERGAFTGAVTAKQGLFEIAHCGSIFLDEIGDMDLQLQPKLLKVLEERKYRRVGDIRDRYVDVRLIAASHHDLLQLTKESRFRSDLYFRISTLPLRLAPLRARRQDIPVLANALLDSICRELGRKSMEITPQAFNLLGDYSWPGNIRELKNVIERAVLLTDSATIGARDLRFDTAAAEPGDDSRMSDVERHHIEHVLEECGGQVSAAARRLGIPRSSLYEKLKQYRRADEALLHASAGRHV